MRNIVAAIAITFLSACGPKPAPEATPSASPHSQEAARFGDAVLQEVTPLATGGAYAIGFSGDVWYLSGAEAIRVKEVSRLSPVAAAPLPRGKEAALFAQLTSERNKHRATTARLEDAQLEEGRDSADFRDDR